MTDHQPLGVVLPVTEFLLPEVYAGVMTTMDHSIVEQLEREVEAAVAEVLDRLGRRNLPLYPSQQTVHLMAKAAVAVYEAAVENRQDADR